MTMALSAGLGLKPEHFEAAFACSAEGLWFEVHPENYMVDGGPRLAWLDTLRSRHALSLHGIGASLASALQPDPVHMARFAALVNRLQPALVSEHLAWSSWNGNYVPDLLPMPRSRDALHCIAGNIARLQDVLVRTVAIENPSHYIHIRGHEYTEIDFLTELSRRTGCGLLLDVNNVFVSANNLGYSANAYIDAFPAELIAEVHLAGHACDPTFGNALLIDSHGAAIAESVWSLFGRLIARTGPRPTLIERDDHLPVFTELLAERNRAHAVLLQSAVEPACG